MLDFLKDIPAAWLALFGTMFGAVGLKVIEHWLGKRTREETSQTSMRNEFREEVKNLKAELDKEEAELDKWKARYYSLAEAYQTVRMDYLFLIKEQRIEGVTVPTLREVTEAQG